MVKSILICAASVFILANLAGAHPLVASPNGVLSLATTDHRGVLARGSVFVVTGVELANGAAVSAEVPYPQELNGVSVAIVSADGAVAALAYMVSTAETRLVAIVPSFLPAGDYVVTVTNNGESSEGTAVKVADASFGLVTNTGSAGGGVSGRILKEGVEPSALTFVNSALPGSTLELDATGLGPLETPDNEFPVEANWREGVVVVLGGVEIPVSYIGRNPLKPGYDKVVFSLPSDVTLAGCLTMFQLKLGDTVSIQYSLPLAAIPAEAAPAESGAVSGEVEAPPVAPSGAVCRGLAGVSLNGLQTLSQGGTLIGGGMTLNRVTSTVRSGAITYTQTSDFFSGGFVQWTAEQFLDNLARGQFQLAGRDANGCVVWDVPVTSGGVYVDAGDGLALNGPAWNVAVPRNVADPNIYNVTLNSVLTGLPTPVITPSLGLNLVGGHYELSGQGGSVVGPFSVGLDVSDAFTWTNQGAFTDKLDRTKDLVFTWTGGQPGDMIVASGYAHGPAPEDSAKLVTRAFSCYTTADQGKVTLAASQLQKLPVIAAIKYTDPSGAWMANISLAHSNPDNTGFFSAPLVNGGTTESAGFRFGYSYAVGPLTIP
ncbi:hypothetical protein [Paludibaculum fermentans]|uniref:Uncharacterized protein n=1 Tax=Paludibaculum fermentans TaxID=1473598 RepID=A0A7S7NJR2_PALFE|nr:hypothetical protein [Paludibaculum fermentans]QOY84916.1 hypothetical protein IRI77_18840 [Paludibaculum fermentans]